MEHAANLKKYIHTYQIDALLLKELSDVRYNFFVNNNWKFKIILANMYLDIEQQVEVELAKIEAALQHAKRADVLIAMDSGTTQLQKQAVVSQKNSS